MSVQIDPAYGVVCHRGDGDLWIRAIYLEASASDTGSFKHFAIYFIDQPDLNGGRGYVNPDNGYVVPRLPAVDFDAVYHLLQTETQIYANWYADDANKIVWFQIGASRATLSERSASIPLEIHPSNAHLRFSA